MWTFVDNYFQRLTRTTTTTTTTTTVTVTATATATATTANGSLARWCSPVWTVNYRVLKGGGASKGRG